MKAIVEHIFNRDYRVRIVHGVQSFRLDYESSKKDCEWMARMFNNALRRHNADIRAKVKR